MVVLFKEYNMSALTIFRAFGVFNKKIIGNKFSIRLLNRCNRKSVSENLGAKVVGFFTAIQPWRQKNIN